MIGVDTNVLVRYVTDDDPARSPTATRFVEDALSTANPGFVSLVVLAELAWVLRSRHRASTGEVAVVVEELASDPRFRLQEDDAVWLALEFVEQGAVDFPDALIAALNRGAGCSNSVTFDRQASRLPRHASARIMSLRDPR